MLSSEEESLSVVRSLQSAMPLTLNNWNTVNVRNGNCEVTCLVRHARWAIYNKLVTILGSWSSSREMRYCTAAMQWDTKRHGITTGSSYRVIMSSCWCSITPNINSTAAALDVSGPLAVTTHVNTARLYESNPRVWRVWIRHLRPRPAYAMVRY